MQGFHLAGHLTPSTPFPHCRVGSATPLCRRRGGMYVKLYAQCRSLTNVGSFPLCFDRNHHERSWKAVLQWQLPSFKRNYVLRKQLSVLRCGRGWDGIHCETAHRRRCGCVCLGWGTWYWWCTDACGQWFPAGSVTQSTGNTTSRVCYFQTIKDWNYICVCMVMFLKKQRGRQGRE